MRRWIPPFALGALATLAVGAIVALFVVENGLFDVRASTPHSMLIAWAAHTTMIHAAQRDSAAISPPAAFTPKQTIAGFGIYDRDCVGCHGAPGVARERLTDGMTPSPPYLVDAPRHWSRAQLYWIVANGVKMTGMPSWSAVHSPGDIWDVVAFLEVQPDLTTCDYSALRAAYGTREMRQTSVDRRVRCPK